MSETAPTRRVLTPNQVVAHNLAAARRLRGWTQQEAAEELNSVLGSFWSVSVWSNAERSATGNRTKHFTADEICAFALIFKLPITWFFLPVTPDDGIAMYGEPIVFKGEEVPRLVLQGPDEFLHRFLDTGEPSYAKRFNELFGRQNRDLTPEERKLTAAEQQLKLAQARVAETRAAWEAARRRAEVSAMEAESLSVALTRHQRDEHAAYAVLIEMANQETRDADRRIEALRDLAEEKGSREGDR